MPAPSILRISPEYGCWPTWDDVTGENLDPADLSIPQALADRIRRWDDAFQATLDQDYPPDSHFPEDAADAAWRAEGEAIISALSEALGPDRIRRGHGL